MAKKPEKVFEWFQNVFGGTEERPVTWGMVTQQMFDTRGKNITNDTVVAITVMMEPIYIKGFGAKDITDWVKDKKIVILLDNFRKCYIKDIKNLKVLNGDKL